MKIYITYFFTSLFTFWIILVFLGMSAGFANYIPLVALIASVFLFVIATPILIYKFRLGLILGLICLLFIVPYSISFTLSIFSDILNSSNLNYLLLLFILPSFIVFLSIYFTLKGILNKDSYEVTKQKVVKFTLAIIPIILFGLYIVLYGKYWIDINLSVDFIE